MPRWIAKRRNKLCLYILCIAVWFLWGAIALKVFYFDREKTEVPSKETVKKDTEFGRMAYDSLFEPDKAIQAQMIGKKDMFLNVCDQSNCQIRSGATPMRNACFSKLSKAKRFNRYRVYYCELKVTVANDQPTSCTPITWVDFKNFCSGLSKTQGG